MTVARDAANVIAFTAIVSLGSAAVLVALPAIPEYVAFMSTHSGFPRAYDVTEMVARTVIVWLLVGAAVATERVRRRVAVGQG